MLFYIFSEISHSMRFTDFIPFIAKTLLFFKFLQFSAKTFYFFIFLHYSGWYYKFRFPVSLITQIEDAIQNHDVSFSGFVLQACEYALENMEPTQKATDNK